MSHIPVRHVGRVVLGAAVFLLSCLLPPPVPSDAASYPRRVAIAPFEVLAKEDLGATAAVLPRLLASRLMALAGADVVLLPPDAKSPEAAAKEAKVPLLLRGTVSKLGKGYSIDTAVTDLETGKPAGAFYAAAATEDDIIPQLGALSGEISEKLFGVQGAIRATAVPGPAPPSTAVPPAPAGTVGIFGTPSAVPTAAAAPSESASPAAPAAPGEGWVPSSLTKVGQSDKIPDEIYGVAAGDVGADGDGEVVAWGRSTIYVYRVRGNDLLPYTRIARPIQNHFMNVEPVDLDGDGRKDLVVSNLVGGRLASFVLVRKGDGFVELPGNTPHHMVVLRGWNGKDVVVGQRQGFGEPFQGKIHVMRWDGIRFAEGDPLPLDTNILPLSAGGVYGLASLPPGKGKDPGWLYVDVEEKLRLLDAGGKSVYKSKERYGAAADAFEFGEFNRQEGKYPVLTLRRAPRSAPGVGGEPLVVVNEVRRGILQNVIGSFESSRVVLLQRDSGGFTERAASPKGDFLYSGAELLPSGSLRRGGRIVASVIEQAGSAFKEKSSRLLLYRVQ